MRRARYTREPMRFDFGASTLVQIFHEAHYANLMGGVMEALGRLLAENVKLYLYPMKVEAFRSLLADCDEIARVTQADGEWVTAETIELQPPIEYLYRYLRDMGWIIGLDPPADG